MPGTAGKTKATVELPTFRSLSHSLLEKACVFRRPSSFVVHARQVRSRRAARKQSRKIGHFPRATVIVVRSRQFRSRRAARKNPRGRCFSQAIVIVVRARHVAVGAKK